MHWIWLEHKKQQRIIFSNSTFIPSEKADNKITTTITTQNSIINQDNGLIHNIDRSIAVATIVVVLMPEVSAQLKTTSAIDVDEQDTGEKCA